MRFLYLLFSLAGLFFMPLKMNAQWEGIPNGTTFYYSITYYEVNLINGDTSTVNTYSINFRNDTIINLSKNRKLLFFSKYFPFSAYSVSALKSNKDLKNDSLATFLYIFNNAIYAFQVDKQFERILKEKKKVKILENKLLQMISSDPKEMNRQIDSFSCMQYKMKPQYFQMLVGKKFKNNDPTYNKDDLYSHYYRLVRREANIELYGRYGRRGESQIKYSPSKGVIESTAITNYPTLDFIETLKLEKVKYPEHRSL